MATTIVTKNGSGAPTASDLVAGELAVDLTNGRLYTEDSGGSVIEIGLNPSGNVDVTGTVTADGLTVDGNATFTTADNTAQVALVSTDADASDGPILEMFRNSSSPADDDDLGIIKFFGENDASEKIEYGIIEVKAVDVSDGTEDGSINLTAMLNGTARSRLFSNSTETVFNEGSQDLDFRVESDNSSHALFVQGSDGNVGIGVSSLNNPLEVAVTPNTTSKTSGSAFDGSAIRLKGELSTTDSEAAIIAGLDNGIQAGIGFMRESISTWGSAIKFYTRQAAVVDLDGVAERMRIDSSGKVLVGKTSPGDYVTGIEMQPAGAILSYRTTNVASIFGRTNEGEITRFTSAGAIVGTIGSRSAGANLYIAFRPEAGGDGCGLTGSAASNGAIIPSDGNGDAVDDHIDLGATGTRFDDIYATSGTVNSSDGNEKQDIEELSDAEQRVAVACKGLLRKFRWISRVAEKGDDARIHFGIIAQDLQAAFEAEGLDAGRYGMFINGTWTDEETGEERSRMGVRYSELLAFIIAAI